MKVKELIALIIKDEWYCVSQSGSHIQYKHHIKKGRVTISYHGKNKDIPIGTLKNVLKQAQIKEGE